MKNMDYSYRPATKAWEAHRDEIISVFSRFKSEKCPKLALYGSVANGWDNEQSDLDIVVFTGMAFTMSDWLEIKSAFENEIRCEVPLHLIFWSLSMERMLVHDGGKINRRISLPG